MRLEYDKEFNILRITIKDDTIVDSEYIEDANMVLDYNNKDEIVAYEIFLPELKQEEETINISQPMIS